MSSTGEGVEGREEEERGVEGRGGERRGRERRGRERRGESLTTFHPSGQRLSNSFHLETEEGVAS